MATPSRHPFLAVSLGDPTGVGPEVSLRAIASGRLRRRVVLVGDLGAARECADRLGLAIPLEPRSLQQAAARDLPGRGGLAVVAPGGDAPLPPLRVGQRRPGKPGISAARVAYESIRTAAAMARDGIVDAICTAPVSKEWLARARLARTGHTEILADFCGVKNARMMMTVDRLRVVLATIHVPLRRVARELDQGRIFDTIDVTDRHLRSWWGIETPRIAVAALNPHAGDGGVYGEEESRIIRPALRRARRRGILVSGPHPADTLFSALGPEVDAIVAMYHDQGLVPIKQRDVHRAVNVTLGLPFVRTSPDHGTGYDIADRGTANPSSMKAAIKLALALAR